MDIAEIIHKLFILKKKKSIGKYKDNLCKSKDCLRAASNLLQSMDFTADPCDDFYKFTCGNWAEDHPR